MGKKEFESAGEAWDPHANQDQATNPETGVAQNGNVHTAAADDQEREEG